MFDGSCLNSSSLESQGSPEPQPKFERGRKFDFREKVCPVRRFCGCRKMFESQEKSSRRWEALGLEVFSETSIQIERSGTFSLCKMPPSPVPMLVASPKVTKSYGFPWLPVASRALSQCWLPSPKLPTPLFPIASPPLPPTPPPLPP